MGIVLGLLSLCEKILLGLWLVFSYLFLKMFRFWFHFELRTGIFLANNGTLSSVCVCLGGLPVWCMSWVLLWTCVSGSDLACQTCLTQVSSTPSPRGYPSDSCMLLLPLSVLLLSITNCHPLLFSLTFRLSAAYVHFIGYSTTDTTVALLQRFLFFFMDFLCAWRKSSVCMKPSNYNGDKNSKSKYFNVFGMGLLTAHYTVLCHTQRQHLLKKMQMAEYRWVTGKCKWCE